MPRFRNDRTPSFGRTDRLGATQPADQEQDADAQLVEAPQIRVQALAIRAADDCLARHLSLGGPRPRAFAFLDHEQAKTELKILMPEDAKEAFGHGIRAKRSKSGAISFDFLHVEASYAPVQ
jgi:hypothetical protein